ncbi:S9 family peptidase [Thalassospira sp. A40-3]|uniref:alpha/beta hydrolase family protein n=1 Tax=Thalassospira sp. A40-3 TaxID=2785908 RepID=UPI002090C59F|nr:alpha/beta hydrolase [Thalassospira sp. A40-3]
MPSPRRIRYHRLVRGAFVLFVLLVAVSGSLALLGLSDFDISNRSTKQISFAHGDAVLSGSLILPDAQHTGPIALLVHGDGPQDRFAGDGYLPLINALLDRGIGIYSWDKAGVGESTGNWLSQSMNDRANEAVAAYDAIKTAYSDSGQQIGFIGFSQAGWVIPKASRMIPDNAFNVIIGGAVNWQDQGAYYTRQRLLAGGATKADITRQLERNQVRDSVFFAPDASYETHLANTSDPSPMASDRFGFVKRNITSDAKADLAQLETPTLAMWGHDDLNVDAKSDADIYRDVLIGRHPENEVVVIPDATHGLLRSNLFNYQLSSEMPTSRQMLYVALGRYAYAPGTFDKIAGWIKQVVEASTPYR